MHAGLRVVEDFDHEDETQRGWWVGFADSDGFDPVAGPFDTDSEAIAVRKRMEEEAEDDFGPDPLGDGVNVLRADARRGIVGTVKETEMAYATFEYEANDGLGQVETYATFEEAAKAAWELAREAIDKEDWDELFAADRGDGVWSIGVERDALVLYGPKSEVEATITMG